MWRLDRIAAAALIGIAPLLAAEDLLRPDVQERIARAVSAVVHQDASAQEEIDAIAELGTCGRTGLLLQLALYLERAPGTEEAMAGALILDRLAFSHAEKLDAVEPHFTAAGAGLRRIFTGILSTIDSPDGGAPDFGVYEERIRRLGAAPPEGLIAYMFEVSPDAALASMERVFGGTAPGRAAAGEDIAAVRGAIEEPHNARNDRARATAALDAMSKETVWWRRLYAAAVLRAQPSLATPAIAARLAQDSHPLVRTTAAPPAPETR